jgi:Fe/S biogenesis protein NfuA
MANVTLKEGIEKSLKEHFPQINAVVDATDHSSGDNPYYK